MVYPERRKNLRVRTELDVNVEFIFPEEIFPLQDKRARALNIGEQGMKLKVSEVSKGFYSKLISDLRSAKISFSLPTTKTTGYILGRIIWSDFDPERQECSFGLNFKRVKPELRRDMHDYIEAFQHSQGLA